MGAFKSAPQSRHTGNLQKTETIVTKKFRGL